MPATVNQVPHWPPHVQPHAPPRSTVRSATFSRTPRHVLHHATSYESTSRLRTTRHVQPHASQRSTARSATFNRTPHNVQQHAPPRSAARHVTFYSTLRHTSQPHVCARLVTAVHTSTPLTDSPHLRSPNLLTSARELARIQQRTLALQPTNSRSNQRTLTPAQRTLQFPATSFTQHSFRS